MKKQPLHLLVAILFLGSILFAGAAWNEPAGLPPGGNIPITQGGALHTGPEYQVKEYGAAASSGGYIGGCAAQPDGPLPSPAPAWTSETGCTFPPPFPLTFPKDAGTIEIQNVELRDARTPSRTGDLSKMVDNLYLDAQRRGAFHVGNLWAVAAAGAGSGSVTARCEPPGTPTPRRSPLTVFGCSASVVDFRNYPWTGCSNYEQCGLIGVYPVDGNGQYTDVNPTGCKAEADPDNPATTVVIAYCGRMGLLPDNPP